MATAVGGLMALTCAAWWAGLSRGHSDALAPLDVQQTNWVRVAPGETAVFGVPALPVTNGHMIRVTSVEVEPAGQSLTLIAAWAVSPGRIGQLGVMRKSEFESLGYQRVPLPSAVIEPPEPNRPPTYQIVYEVVAHVEGEHEAPTLVINYDDDDGRSGSQRFPWGTLLRVEEPLSDS